VTIPSDTFTLAANRTRELAAIMFSDIAGYTAIMGRDEQKAIGALADYRETHALAGGSFQRSSDRRHRRWYAFEFP